MNPGSGSSAASLRRVAVVGATGAGKTHLAQALAQRLGAPHIELDAFFWEPGWRRASREDFRPRVERALAGEAWVADGNAHLAQDIVWSRATALVWLDYPLPIVLWRLTSRTLRRFFSGERLWNNNRQRPGTGLHVRLWGSDSLLWALQSTARHRREYPALLARPDYAHLAVVRLRSPRAAGDWLASLTSGGQHEADGH